MTNEEELKKRLPTITITKEVTREMLIARIELLEKEVDKLEAENAEFRRIVRRTP